ncbi:GNAT family N-acetyltransferase [Aquihabitans sp. McL0605]|uniref:GNAT family N-acetyltransferase n=1 Tax=Aquihabitans sp. McL0605 TaxID=3415671 RepID=UPI003CECC2A2
MIDITDATLAKQALYDQLVRTTPAGEQVIDLRDEVLAAILELAPTGRTILPSERASGRPPDLQEGVHLEIPTTDAEWKRVEEFVYDTYLELGYTEENRDHEVAELAEYRSRSRFHVAVNADGGIVGSLRVIMGEYHDLPVGKFQRIDFADEEPMCHMSSIVVDPAARSKGVIEHLYRAGWADGVRHGARTISGLSERWMLEGFREVYCMPFVPSGVPEWYMGGEVIPMTMSTSVAAMEQVARANPEFWLWNLEELTDQEVEHFGFSVLRAAPKV